MMTRLMVRILNKLKQDEVVEDICGRPRRWADLMDREYRLFIPFCIVLTMLYV